MSLMRMAPGVPGQIILSPHVAPALPISPVIESIATIEKVCCEKTEKGMNSKKANNNLISINIASINE